MYYWNGEKVYLNWCRPIQLTFHLKQKNAKKEKQKAPRLPPNMSDEKSKFPKNFHD